ncbi:NmrA family NAD(P)-binding protein [Leucobacter chromiireducens]|uniref:NmrA family NAD(P)-binding protein n=1 Tax=Leucobacter chromiireducens TaxID=283877 RepID=UPI000F634A3A|nr:NmrA family NAD(P)-binding protein [Leucobacter chromiireducens]
MSRAFITGATGIVGSSVLQHLLDRGEQVIAGVRDDTAEVPAGAEKRRFAFGDAPEELRASMAGADRLFLMRPPAIADVAQFLFPVIDAALSLGMRQIVFLSLQGVQGNRKTPHHAVEQYLRRIDAPSTFLRPNFFMQNLSTVYAPGIRERGEIFVPAGRSRTAFIDAKDIGRVAAAVMTEPGHLRRAYTRPSEREYLDALAAAGAPADYLDVQKMIHRVVRLNISAIPNRSIRALTGQPATRFEQFVRENRDAWDPVPPGSQDPGFR